MARKQNERLRTAHARVEYNMEQVMEFARCARDPIYFIKNYVYVQHPTKGKVRFNLYPYQEKMIKAYMAGRYTVVLSARQTGKCFFYSTSINAIEKPIGIKKLILYLLDRKEYEKIFKCV